MKTYTDFGHCLQDDATKASFPKTTENKLYRKYLAEVAASEAQTVIAPPVSDDNPTLAERVAALEAAIA